MVLWRATTLKAFNDDHVAAAAGAGMLWCFRLVGLGGGGFDGIDGEQRHREQFAGARNVLGTLAAGEQAVIADAVEASGQDVDQEPADELVGWERHCFVTLRAFEAVVLP